MGDQDRRRIEGAQHADDLVTDLSSHRLIEGTERLIEQDQSWVERQCARQCHSLALAS